MLKKYKTLKITKNNKINNKCCNYFTILYKKNNTFASFYNNKKKILKSLSAGQLKEFKSFEKKSVIASETVVSNMLNLLVEKELNLKEGITLNIKGLDKFKPEIIQLFCQKKLNIIKIKNISGIPHGGCRSKKKRRK